jgi:hypothetical protein
LAFLQPHLHLHLFSLHTHTQINKLHNKSSLNYDSVHEFYYYHQFQEQEVDTAAVVFEAVLELLQLLQMAINRLVELCV